MDASVAAGQVATQECHPEAHTGVHTRLVCQREAHNTQKIESPGRIVPGFHRFVETLLM